MYIKTSQAATWVESAIDARRKPAPRPPRVQRWATRPLRTPYGTAYALRFDGSYARVLMEVAGRRRWTPLSQVMTKEQAARWIRTSFGRG